MAKTAISAPDDSNNKQVPTKEVIGFGEQSLERSAELAAIAVSASARAEVEAAYKMAMMNPRNEEDARIRILAACARPLFSAKAKYRKPQGGKMVNGQWQPGFVVGPSIRFAEEMLRCWKNVGTQQTAIYDDSSKRIVRITTRDLEANTFYSKEITLEKQVERKSGKDREILGQRMNTNKEIVYIVRATEDELANKEAAQASKSIRNNGLRLIPQHIVDEAMDTVDKVMKDKVAKDPDGERRALLDGFGKRGVMPSDLEKYIGTPSKQFSTEDLVKLRDILNAIEDGHATWAEFLEGTVAGATQDIQDKSQADTKGAQVLETLKTVAEERGVQASQASSKAAEAEPTKQEGQQAERAEVAKEKPAQAASEAKVEDESQFIQAIKAAEAVLQDSEPGKKKMNVILSQLKVRLSSGQTPLDVIPVEQRAFYLNQLSKAVDSLREAK
mgnify:CR=1 FL=1